MFKMFRDVKQITKNMVKVQSTMKRENTDLKKKQVNFEN